MANVRITGWDATKTTITAAREASALNPGVIYLVSTGAIVFNNRVYANITGAKIGNDAVTINNAGELVFPQVWAGNVPLSQKGVAGGVATLDGNGKLSSSQIPAGVDEIQEMEHVLDKVENGNHRIFRADTPASELEKPEASSYYYAVLEPDVYYFVQGVTSGAYDKRLFVGPTPEPVSGDDDKIYVDVYTNRSYRWGGQESGMVEISSSLSLGETAGTAYRGDRGKAAYDAAVAQVGQQIRGYDRASTLKLVSEKAIAERLDAIEAALTVELPEQS